MTQMHQPVGLPGSVVWMLKSLEGEVRAVAARVARTIVEILADDTGPEVSDHTVFMAVHSALAHFVDLSMGREAPYVAIDDHYRRIGYRLAAAGRDRVVVDQALHVATTEVWDELRKRAAANELSAAALNAINEAVTGYVEHLTHQVDLGFEAGSEARDQDAGVARARLVDRLLGGAEQGEVEQQAAIAGWEVPDELTVMVVEIGERQRIARDALDDVALTRRRPTGQVVICPADQADTVTEQVRDAVPEARVVVCWPVPPGDVAAAWRWVNRALGLVRAKVIPARPVIHCRRHRTEIWLHAEPVMRRQLAQELLQPLFAETPNSREILSETLLVWLETRDSAPAIAARLGVHPQTVRYRWKRINDLFGEALHDPEFVVQLTLLLKASVPLWVAGDQSDFRRYQELTR
ncbi:MAG: helix-turn-helix domain-containing protein [Nocardioidaceae bacterium]|nr:helix-turn-helix domain-containing protein [Nocardioidaceae bacterium]MCL2611833.1 helix-turn-helix domain-containing protein [Nocardioidaceae bacterium]